MEKSYVSMEQKMCPVCGKEYESGGLLLDKQLRNKFESKTTTGYKLCPEHQKKWDEGFVAIVICDETKSGISGGMIKAEDAFRTGEIIHMKKEVFKKMFNQEPRQMVFGDSKLAIEIKKMVEQ